MGFKRGRPTHKEGHHFSNDPDIRHQTCVTCGCRRVITYSNKTETKLTVILTGMGTHWNLDQSNVKDCLIY